MNKNSMTGITTSARPMHVCNCIGCCPLCGMCRTSPGHTIDFCALLVRQAAERTAFFCSANDRDRRLTLDGSAPTAATTKGV